MFACLHDMHLHVSEWRTNYCLIVLSLHSPLPPPHTPSSAPSFGQLETEFIRFVLLLFSLPTAPFPPPPPFPSPPHCRNRICRNHSKARYNLLLAVHNTPSHSHPLSQSHKVPCGWTNHTWNIISASYSSILWTAPFYGAMDLTPAWSHSHQSVQEERGWVVWVESVIQKNLLFLHFFVYISAVMVVLINSYFTQTLISPGDDSIVQKKTKQKKTLLREHTSSSQELHQQTHKKLFHGALLPVVPLLSLCNPHIWTSNSSSFIIYTSQ